MLKLNDFLGKVNVIINAVETKDINYKILFIDFVSENSSPDFFKKNGDLINKIHIDDDFQPLYNEILSKLITSSELSINNNPDLKDKFIINVNDETFHDVTKTEDENKIFLQRRIISRINNASNFIATEGRIGPAQYIIINKNNQDYIQYLMNWKLNNYRIIFDNIIPDDTILLGRKNSIDQPTTNLVYYIDNDIFYYDIAETGKYYFKQYSNIKLNKE